MEHSGKRGLMRTVLVGAILLCVVGCTPQQENQIISELQTALTDLNQNRSLTEQFVRDVKASTDPDNTAYVQAMESYQDARDAYNRYLDEIESGIKPGDARSLHRVTSRDVQNATADFLADATRALKPSVNTRRIAFQRAVVIPENLQLTLAKLPKKTREQIVDQLDEQVRWRTWSQL